MNQSHAKRPVSRWAGATLVAALMLAPATTAKAEVNKLTGVDYLYKTENSYVVPVDEGVSGYVDILAVSSNDEADMVYLKLTTPSGKVVVDHLGYMLGDAAAPEGIDSAVLVTDPSNTDEYVAMVDINVDQLPFAGPDSYYVIDVFRDRDETDQVYSGKVQMIYGLFEGDENPQPIAVRTEAVDASDLAGRGCPAPAQVVRDNGNVVYNRTSEEPNADGVYEYKLASDLDDSFSCKINYYLLGDSEMKPLDIAGNEPVTLKKGDTKTVSIEPLVTATSGNYYRTLTVGNSVKLSYPGMTEAAVFVKELTGSWASGAPYTARISYVDENDAPLAHNGMEDRLAVIRPYSYTPPKSLYIVKDGKVLEYVLSDNNADLDANNAMTFNPGDQQDTSVVTKKVVYRLVEGTDEGSAWIVNYYVTGTSGETGNQASRLYDQFRITDSENAPERGTLADGVYTPEASLSVDGQTLVPTQSSFDLNASGRSVINVYYTLDGDETPLPSYNFTVNYVNIANPTQVIRTQQQSVSITADRSTAEADVSVPSEFAEGGVNWVILPGQLDGGPDTYHLYHSYYSRPVGSTEEPVYTVYYRDINDDLHANTVVTRVVTVYDDVVVTDQGTTTTGTTTAAAGAAATDNAAAAGAANATLQTGTGLQNIGGDNGATIVRPDGTSTTEERIQEEETPLAGPDGTNATDAAHTVNVNPLATGGLIAAIAAVGALLAVLFARRAKNDEAKVQSTDSGQSQGQGQSQNQDQNQS